MFLANRSMGFAHEDYEIHTSDAAVALSIINICEIFSLCSLGYLFDVLSIEWHELI